MFGVRLLGPVECLCLGRKRERCLARVPPEFVSGKVKSSLDRYARLSSFMALKVVGRFSIEVPLLKPWPCLIKRMSTRCSFIFIDFVVL